MTTLRVRAPAKINWTLEVLGKRRDGYHEVRSILQTVDLRDVITLRAADELSVSVAGAAGALATEQVEENLAYRAASLLCGARASGARITLDKHIPIAAGLGGGSSDAAAVLRGLRTLWSLNIADDELSSLAAQLGSDVPFFLRGGTALVSGRGDVIEQLPDAPEQRLIIAWNEGVAEENKTASMYGALQPEHYTDGATTDALVARIRSGAPVRDEDTCNVFEGVQGKDRGRATGFSLDSVASFSPHLCGSGSARYFIVPSSAEAETVRGLLQGKKLLSIATQTLSGPEVVGIERLD